MLIHNLIDFCDKEYQKRNCSYCKHRSKCKGNCQKCLDDIHFHVNEIWNQYDCEHLLDYYVCKYSYRYCSEIIYALKKIEFSKYPHLNILSLGCGGAADLMAFDYLHSEINKQIYYCGMDINPVWAKIHNIIQLEFLNGEAIFHRNCNVLEDFQQNIIEGYNVFVIEYLISYFYSRIGQKGIKQWFDDLVRNVIAHKPQNSPALIIINDVDSYHTGRDTFEYLSDSIQMEGLEILSELKLRFNETEHYKNSSQHLTQRNFFKIPEQIKDNYNTAIKCDSVQFILEVI